MKTTSADNTDGLSKRAEQASDWLLEQAFPLWGGAGASPGGRFWESLDLSGKPLRSPRTRVRVQARQTYMFCLALAMGWNPGDSEKLIEQGLKTLRTYCRRPDGVYGETLFEGQGLTSHCGSLYDSAFALLAYATAIPTRSHDFALDAGNELLSVIQTTLRRPAPERGFYEQVPVSPVRLQNPHMHLFEALLAWCEHSGQVENFELCQEILEFVNDVFIDSESGALFERSAVEGPCNDDNWIEAGHHFEWFWLLRRYETLSKNRVPDVAEKLYATGVQLTDSDWRIPLSHHLDFGVRERIYRAWGMTEALKAHLVRYEEGDNGAYPAVISTYDRLWADHISAAIPGGWIDQLDKDGRPVSETIPSSTGYHVVLAFNELDRVAEKMGLEMDRI